MVRPQIVALMHFWWLRRRRGFLSANWATRVVWLATAVLVTTIFPSVILGMFGFRQWLIVNIPEVTSFVDLAWSFALAIFFLSVFGIAYIRALSEFGRAEPNIAVGWPWHSATQLSARLARAIGRSFWPIVVLGWPLLIAAAWPDISGQQLWFSFLTAVLLGLAAICWGIALGLISLRVEWRASAALGRVVAAAVFGVSLLALARGALLGMEDALNTGQIIGRLPPFDALASIALNSATGSDMVVWPPYLMIFTLIALGLSAVYFIGRFGHRYWLRVDELPPRPVRRSGFRPWPKFLAPRHIFLFEKERLSLVRDVGALGKLAIVILLIVAILLLGVHARAVLATGDVVGLADLMAGLMVGLGACAIIVGLNFCFPALSLEARESWLLRATPLHLHELYSWKLFFWSFLLLVINVPAAILMAYWLRLPAFLVIVMAVVALIMTLSLVSLTLGQGFIFPHGVKPRLIPLNLRRPERLTESPAGLFALLLGTINLFVIFRYLRRFVGWYLVTGEADSLSLLGLSIVSISIVIFYWLVAPLRLEQEERCC